MLTFIPQHIIIIITIIIIIIIIIMCDHAIHYKDIHLRFHMSFKRGFFLQDQTHQHSF